MTVNSFFDAVSAGDVATVESLLHDNPTLIDARDPESGISPVLTALYRGKRPMAELLASHGATLDIFDAVAIGDLPRLRTLLDSDNALTQAWSTDGFQAVHLAAFFGQPDALKLLLDRGAPADLQARHPFGVRPLHSAVACGDADKARRMAKTLIARGADVNARQGGGETGFTPLMAAAQHGDAVLADLLLAAGADTSVRTAEGKTALDFARESGHDEALGERLAVELPIDSSPSAKAQCASGL